MGRLTYGMFMSLDGYLAGPTDHFDAEAHAFIIEQMRAYGTEIYGRRMYEAMLFWETYEERGDGSADFEDEFARGWRQLDKIVVSSTLERVSSGNTTLVREFRPDDIRRLKATSDEDIAVAGPTLASHVIREGLVDEYALYTVPVVLGSGDPVFADVGERLDLDVVDQRRFASGMTFTRYVPRVVQEARP